MSALNVKPPTLSLAEYTARALETDRFREDADTPGWGYSPIYLAGWMLAAGGLVVAMRAARAPLPAILLPGVIAASHFIAVVAVYPKGERLILPIYALLVPYAGIAVATAAGAARRRLGW